MVEQGQVIELLPDNYVKIRVERTEACAKCGACALPGKDMTVIAYNPNGAGVSDYVTLSLESRYFLSAALILYGVPLLALLAGTAAGYYGAESLGLSAISPIAGLITGIVLTGLTYFVIRLFDLKIKKSLYMPTAHPRM
ncbi:MAG: SoxR reducing system RseC family protein [Clostridiales bacterium]|jgi:sigma-E factor negative regulatory protein RseC|nr:SoxR reducing system RseC family protein [Clostridiales bacterium]